ncbi:MAG: DUF4199 domain-containing protein [Verrucomicrobia bacterium]|nr:DUF4199 domain-containing protein [Verrucomicrobiota bacterium]
MKPELKFGLTGGAAVSAWLLVASLVGFHTQQLALVKYSDTTSLAVLAGVIYLALKSRRARSQDCLTLEQGWKTGTLIALVSGAIAALFKVAYNHVVNPGWVEKAIQWETARMKAANAPEQKIASMETYLRATNSDFFLVTLGIAGTVVLGTFIALALAFALQRKPAQT